MKWYWRVVAIAVSLLPLLIIALLVEVEPKDIIAVGLMPFAIASIASVIKLILQGLRFHYFVARYVGPVSSIRTNMVARIGSEFVSLTTPAYIGGEFVRLAWLHKRGVDAGKGMWVITVEVINDVLVGSMLSYMAAIWAFLAGNYIIAIGIVVIISPIFLAYITLLIMSSKRILHLPKFSSPLLGTFIGHTRAETMIGAANSVIKGLCEMSKENLHSSSLKIFGMGLALTFVMAVVQAAAFMVLASTVQKIGFFESIMAVAASIAIATLPITPGGSGTSEFGIGAYLPTFGLDPLAFGTIIIAWRIASYHVPLIISWFFLMKVAVSKLGRPQTP